MVAKIKSIAPRGANGYKHKPRGVSDSAFARVYWPYLPLVLIVGALLTFGAQAGAIQAAVTRHHTKVLDYATSMSIGGLLADTNAARNANGVSSLTLNSQLDAAAQAQANDMAARNYWSHYTPEGSPPWVWVTNQGYSYQALAQNLAAGFTNEQATVDGWMGSPDHRTNMLNSIYTDVGFGSANNPNYTSAGGGPMTIVVAFYGEPTHSVPPPAAAPAAPTGGSTPAATPSSPTPVASTPTPTTSPTTSGSSPSKSSVNKADSSANTPEATTSSGHGITLSYRTSKAQIAFAHLPQATYATTMVVVAAVAAFGLWLSQHLLTLRRVFVYGESFVIKHPLIDVGLLTISAISFMLTQTAGFIR